MGDQNSNEYNGNELIIVCIIFLSLTYLSVLLRVFVKVRILKTFQLDDYLMVVSQVRFVQ
jgi:hypothetical protein